MADTWFGAPAASKADRLRPYQFKRKDYLYNSTEYTRGKKYDREKLLKDARKVAKATNQRLLRLEKAGLTEAPAYRGAVKALSGMYTPGEINFGHVDKKGRPRYQERRLDKLSNEELLKMLYALDKTQQAKTSTPAGAQKVYSKGLDRVNDMLESAGEQQIALDDFLYILRSKAMSNSLKLYGYKAVLQLVGEVQRSGGATDTIDAADEVAQAVAKGMDLAEVRRILGLKNQKITSNEWIDAW